MAANDAEVPRISHAVVLVLGSLIAIIAGLMAAHSLGGYVGAIAFWFFGALLLAYTVALIPLSLFVTGVASIENYISISGQEFQEKEKELEILVGQLRSDYNSASERDVQEECANRIERILEREDADD